MAKVYDYFSIAYNFNAFFNFLNKNKNFKNTNNFSKN